jgi:hypothetical protein
MRYEGSELRPEALSTMSFFLIPGLGIGWVSYSGRPTPHAAPERTCRSKEIDTDLSMSDVRFEDLKDITCLQIHI